MYLSGWTQAGRVQSKARSCTLVDRSLVAEHGKHGEPENIMPHLSLFVSIVCNEQGCLDVDVAANIRTRAFDIRNEIDKVAVSEVFLWSMALIFMGLVCIPGMPLWVVIPSIVLMQSLNSCTKAFNRAQLINFLPREKIATYMRLVSLCLTLSHLVSPLLTYQMLPRSNKIQQVDVDWCRCGCCPALFDLFTSQSAFLAFCAFCAFLCIQWFTTGRLIQVDSSWFKWIQVDSRRLHRRLHLAKDMGCPEQSESGWHCNLWSSSGCSCWLSRMLPGDLYHSFHSKLKLKEIRIIKDR